MSRQSTLEFRCRTGRSYGLQGQTVGVIALSGTLRASEAAKGVLRVICQMGALAIYNTRSYNEMKITAQMDGLTRLYNKSHITLILVRARSMRLRRDSRHCRFFCLISTISRTTTI